MTVSHVRIAVEEPPQLVLELWEFLLAWISFIVFEVVVQHVDGLLTEEFAYFGVAVNHFPKIGLLHIGIESLIAQPCVEHNQWQHGECFEAQTEMEELVEEQRGEWQHIPLEGIGDA